MKHSIHFNTNAADLETIHTYLLRRNKDFTPSLSDKLDIYDFASKMYKHANIYTVHENDKVIGLAGCYANDFTTLQAYITNFSIHPNYYGSGLAEELIDYCQEDLVQKGFRSIKLEVNNKNSRAINFYEKMGFSRIQENLENNSMYMLKYLIPRT